MTLQELIKKLLVINSEIKMQLLADRINKNSDVYFFAEDDYNTIDVKINKVEVEEGKIYLS
jgi:hypothetical protein|tara:strand:+ start:288 stop:470 length:183 start_codon:yes stop_codon:yes gene_type:complete